MYAIESATMVFSRSRAEPMPLRIDFSRILPQAFSRHYFFAATLSLPISFLEYFFNKYEDVLQAGSV